jgi:type II secretory pathway pseudopilin PulG
MRYLLRNQKGITLLELIIILIILGILASIAIPKYFDVSKDAADTSAISVLAGLRTANQLEISRRAVRNMPYDYTLGDILSNMTYNPERLNYSNQDRKIHITINGYSYWYTMSADTPPTINEWKPMTPDVNSGDEHSTWRKPASRRIAAHMQQGTGSQAVPGAVADCRRPQHVR